MTPTDAPTTYEQLVADLAAHRPVGTGRIALVLAESGRDRFDLNAAVAEAKRTGPPATKVLRGGLDRVSREPLRTR